MEKMRMETPDLTAANVEKIGALFPNCITETLDEEKSTPEKKVYKKAVNFDLLRQMLSGNVIEGDEAYEFTWVGKKAAIVEANKPIRKTLRPCPEESVNWDTTENLYIEGDNLEVLKLLQESYLGKVKLIYIDPPYNTGGDFIYRDDFHAGREDYEKQMGLFDEEGDRLFKNTDSNGRFHSDWCSMIYPRLFFARTLLADDGVIFVSMDFHEQPRLRMIMDEVFGASNFISEIACVNKPSGRSDDKYIATAHENILIYCKSPSFSMGGFTPEENVTKRYSKEDSNGRLYREEDLRKRGTHDERRDRPNLFYPFFYCESTNDLIVGDNNDITPDGYIRIVPIKSEGIDGTWRWGQDTAKNQINYLHPRYMQNKGQWSIFEWEYLDERGNVKPTSVWAFKDVNSERGTEVFSKFLGFNKALFPNPKPVGTIERILRIATKKDDIVLDFFSGSSTTAHAVMQLNSEDGAHRKFIMVQLREETDSNSEAYQAGFHNICDIGKERIRRAGTKIREENPLTTQDLDIGFRVFKLDDSNMNDVYYAAGDYTQDLLTMLESNVKPDRTDLDLLFGCLLEWGLPLSMPYKSEKIDGYTVHTYNDGDLIACFDENVPDSVIKEIAKRQPLRAVFRDSSFRDSPAKINVGEIFKMLAPDTRVKVI